MLFRRGWLSLGLHRAQCVAAQLMSGKDRGLLDGDMVIFEDVLDDEDDEKDAAPSHKPSPSFVSPYAPPFILAYKSTGKSKS